MNRLYFFVLTALLVSLMGCSTPLPASTAQDASENLLAGTYWKLTSFKNRLAMEKYPIYLHFDEKKMVGEMGCNNYDADYQVEPKNEESQISIGLLAVTVQLCQDEALMDQETRYIEAWREAAMPQPADFQIGVDGSVSTLQILDKVGDPVLSFESAGPQP